MTAQPESEPTARVDETTWSALAPHEERGGLFFVSAEIGLATAAAAIAHDRGAVVAQWIASGLVRRPTQEERTSLSADPESRTFRFVIVQPYVLVEA